MLTGPEAERRAAWRANEEAKLATGLGSGQWIEPPVPRRKASLEERAFKAVVTGKLLPAITDELRASGAGVGLQQLRLLLDLLNTSIEDRAKLRAVLHDHLGVTDTGKDVTATGHVCGQCGRSFSGVRSDAAYCSGACRQKAYRQRGGS